MADKTLDAGSFCAKVKQRPACFRHLRDQGRRAGGQTAGEPALRLPRGPYTVRGESGTGSEFW